MHGAIEAAFIGRVGQDPELKTSAAGKPWARFSVAGEGGRDAMGQRGRLRRDG